MPLILTSNGESYVSTFAIKIYRNQQHVGRYAIHGWYGAKRRCEAKIYVTFPETNQNLPPLKIGRLPQKERKGLKSSGPINFSGVLVSGRVKRAHLGLFRDTHGPKMIKRPGSCAHGDVHLNMDDLESRREPTTG